MSSAVDDFLKGIVDVLETARKAGRFTISDMFNMMAKQMELLTEEVKRNDKPAQKEAEVEEKSDRTKKQLGKLAKLIRKT